jgi:hypothetical protein
MNKIYTLCDKKEETVMLNFFKLIFTKKFFLDKSFLWIFIFFVSAAFRLNAFSANTPINSYSNKQLQKIDVPKLVFDKKVYNFGNITPNSTIKAVFNLKNTGGKTLIIKDVKKCCESVIELDKKELEPGRRAVLTAEYPVGAETGLFKKTIEVVTNEPNSSQNILTITGKIIQTLEWEPKNFEISAFKKDAECPEITITSLDDTKFSVKGFASTNQCLQAEFDPNYSSTQITLKPVIKFDELKQLASNKCTINIELNHPNYKTISLSFDIIPSLQATPSLILVFKAGPNEPVIRSIKIQDNRNQALSDFPEQIESVVFKNGASVEILKSTNNGNNICKLDLKIMPSNVKGSELSLRDELLIKMKDGRELNIPVRIFYKS